MNIIRLLRTLQCYAPSIRPLKFDTYNLGTKWLGWRVEPEFNYLSQFAPVDLALDIGGNWGQSILALGRTAAPQHTVSFEPNPVLANRLAGKYASDKRVKIEPCALGEVPGELELFIPRYRNFIFDGLASLDEESAAQWLNPERMAGFDPNKLSIERYVVEVRTLDSFDLSPEVVKIDVQGFELQVVKGGEMTFRRTRPITIVESPTKELVSMFGDIGMAPYGYVDGRLELGNTSRTNTIFIHADRLQGPFGKVGSARPSSAER